MSRVRSARNLRKHWAWQGKYRASEVELSAPGELSEMAAASKRIDYVLERSLEVHRRRSAGPGEEIQEVDVTEAGREVAIALVRSHMRSVSVSSRMLLDFRSQRDSAIWKRVSIRSYSVSSCAALLDQGDRSRSRGRTGGGDRGPVVPMSIPPLYNAFVLRDGGHLLTRRHGLSGFCWALLVSAATLDL